MDDGWNRGGCGQRGRGAAIESIGGCTVTFPGKVEIDVCLPGQDCSFVTLEIVRTHVGVQVAPVTVSNGRVVVAAFVGGIAMMADGSNI